MFHDHEHVKNLKSGARYDAEVTGDDGVGVSRVIFRRAVSEMRAK